MAVTPAEPGADGVVMAQTLSQNFIGALEERRDRLYAAALTRAGSPGGAEQILLDAVRKEFAQYARDGAGDVTGAMERSLGAGSGDTPMPADMWARLAAAVQVEAAKSRNAAAIHPDSVLLKPDPMLAPSKAGRKRQKEEFDLASPSRLIMVGGLAILVGVVLTVYILTRPAAPQPGTPPSGGASSVHGEGP
jgi:hypothetical protein